MKTNTNYSGHNTQYDFTMPLMVNGVRAAELEIRCTLIVCGEHDDLEINAVEEIEVEGWKDGTVLDADNVYVAVPDWLDDMVLAYLDAGGFKDSMEHVYERYSEDAH